MEPIPPKLRQAIDGGSLESVTQGMSGDDVYRLRRGDNLHYVKIARGRRVSRLKDEARRTAALRALGVTVPSATLFTDGKRSAALLMEALPGEPANTSALPPDVIVPAIGRALADLHTLPPDAFPYDESITIRLAQAKSDIASGEVDSSQFEPRNRDTSPLALLERLSGSMPPEEAVVVHGDATLDNMIAAENGTIGFIDCGRAGRADRYTDLAVITADIAERFGPNWAEAFLRAYGAPLDPAKAAYFADLYELF